jgi:REP element-mobilizing transposase RayT
MPRLARLDIAGLLQHVIVRGIERRDIFNDDHDRQLFFDRFAKLLSETGVRCYAWALLSNHFHLLLMPTSTALSSFMRRLLTGYAVSFNRHNNRSGYLFQNRYKSIVCEEEAYLLELVRYIHLNPLRAGMVKNLEELDQYPWGGHAVLLGNRIFAGQETEAVLDRFGQKLGTSRKAIGERL